MLTITHNFRDTVPSRNEKTLKTHVTTVTDTDGYTDCAPDGKLFWPKVPGRRDALVKHCFLAKLSAIFMYLSDKYVYVGLCR